MVQEIETPPPATLRLYTTDEAAVLLHCGKRYLYELVQRRKAPHTKIGRRILFSEEHLRAIVKNGERPVVHR